MFKLPSQCVLPRIAWYIAITYLASRFWDCFVRSAGKRPSEPGAVREADLQAGHGGPETSLRFGCDQDKTRRWWGHLMPQVIVTGVFFTVRFFYGAMQLVAVFSNRTASYAFFFHKTAPYRTEPHRRILTNKNLHRTAPHRTILN